MKNKQSGFSLIEVVVASGIMLTVSLAIGKLIAQQSKSISYLEDRLERTALEAELKIALKDKTKCKKAIRNTIIPQKNKTKSLNLKNLDLGDNITAGGRYGNLRITKAEIKNLDINTRSLASLTKASGVAEIIVHTQSRSKTDMKPIKTPINVTVDTTSTPSCTAEAFCKDKDGTIKQERSIETDSGLDSQRCVDGKWVTTSKGCEYRGKKYVSGKTFRRKRRFRRDKKYVCVDGRRVYLGKFR